MIKAWGVFYQRNVSKENVLASKYFFKQSLLETGWETYFLQKSNKEGNIHNQRFGRK